MHVALGFGIELQSLGIAQDVLVVVFFQKVLDECRRPKSSVGRSRSGRAGSRTGTGTRFASSPGIGATGSGSHGGVVGRIDFHAGQCIQIHTGGSRHGTVVDGSALETLRAFGEALATAGGAHSAGGTTIVASSVATATATQIVVVRSDHAGRTLGGFPTGGRRVLVRHGDR